MGWSLLQSLQDCMYTPKRFFFTGTLSPVLSAFLIILPKSSQGWNHAGSEKGVSSRWENPRRKGCALALGRRTPWVYLPFFPIVTLWAGQSISFLLQCVFSLGAHFLDWLVDNVKSWMSLWYNVTQRPEGSKQRHRQGLAGCQRCWGAEKTTVDTRRDDVGGAGTAPRGFLT